MAPDAEVIVAPKTRAKQQPRSNKDSKSVGGTSRKSGKSSASTARRRSAREEKKPSLFLRGVERPLCQDYFDDEPSAEDLSVWVDHELLLSKDFAGIKWVTVNVLRPAGLQQPIDARPSPQNWSLSRRSSWLPSCARGMILPTARLPRSHPRSVPPWAVKGWWAAL